MANDPTGQPVVDGMSNVWIYSFSPDVGLRAQTQLPLAVVVQPNDPGLPADFTPDVAAIVKRFDSQDFATLGADDINELLIGVLLFARSCPAWTQMPALESTPSIHVVVVDWHAPGGGYGFQAIGAQGSAPQPLAPITVEQLAQEAIRRETAKAQQDTPSK